MKQIEIKIENPTGLHARPAKVFVNVAKGFQSDIRVYHGEKKANAKSLISLLTLGVETGSEIKIEVNGDDEEVAIVALESAIRGGLGEEELLERVKQEKETKKAQEPANFVQPKPLDIELPANCIQGIPGAQGISIGPIYHLINRTEITIADTQLGEQT